MLAPVLSVDTETNGKDVRDGTGYCIGISISGRRPTGEIFSYYFPVAHEKDNVDIEVQIQLLEIILSHRCIVFHNRKFDMDSLKTWLHKMNELQGGLLAKYQRRFNAMKSYCTMIMAHLVNENWASKALDWLAKNVLHIPGKNKPPIWQAMFDIYGWSEKFPAEIMALYATVDAEITLLLFEYLIPTFRKEGYDSPLQFL